MEPHPCPPLRKDKECGIIWIDKVEEVLLGHYAKISIFGENFRFEMGAFDFLIAYDAPALTFIEAQPGQMLDSCNWEYFTYRFGADGNCGDACPSGLLRIIALAETNNGPIHPTCFGPPDTDPHELADLTFYVTPDRTIQGQYLPVWFFWGDCGDNTISNVGGDTLYLDRCVRDFQDNVIWNELDDENYPETGRIRFVGAPDACILDTALRPDLKTVPTRCICFRFGGFDIIPDTLIDARGDINLNGIPNEVADAVMLTNYFIEGPTAFDNHYEGSVAASDVNADGIALSIGDLVYLIRIITGDALPYAKPVASAEPAQLSLLVNHTAASLAVNSAADLGAGYFVINHTGYTVSPPQLINGASDMTLKYSDENGILKVLVYSMEKDHKIAAGSQHLLVIPISGQGTLTIQDAQLADYFGRLIPVETAGPAPMPSAYALHQNYPNPFNATTRIIYELPQPAQVKLEIINVLGQTVATVIDRYESAGIHSAEWSGTDGQGHPVASGIYLYRMTAGGFTAEKKMVLMK